MTDLTKLSDFADLVKVGEQQQTPGNTWLLYNGAGLHQHRVTPYFAGDNTKTPPVPPDTITHLYAGCYVVVDTSKGNVTVPFAVPGKTGQERLSDGAIVHLAALGAGDIVTSGALTVTIKSGLTQAFIFDQAGGKWIPVMYGAAQSGGTAAQQKGAVTFAGKISPTDVDNFKLPTGIAGNSGYDLVYLYYDLKSKNADVLIWPNGAAADPNALQWQAMPLVDYNFMDMFKLGLDAKYEPKRKYAYFQLWPAPSAGPGFGVVKGVQHTQITAICVLSPSSILVATADANATQGALWESDDFGRTWELQTINIRPEGYQPKDPPYPADHADIVFTGAVESIIPGKGGKPILSMNYTAVAGKEQAFVYVWNSDFGFWNEEGIDGNVKHNYDTLTAMGGSVVMVAASPDCTIMRSGDNGDSWKPYVTNLEGTGSADTEEVTRMIHSGNGELLACVNPGGVLHRIDATKVDTVVFRAGNGGGNWIHDMLDFGGSVVILAVGASDTEGDDDPNSGNIFRSVDNGVTWGAAPQTNWTGIKSTGRFIDFGGGHVAIAIERITTGVEGIKNTTYETWYSDDYGQTWQQLAWADANSQSLTPGVSRLTARLGDLCLVYYPGKGLYRETRP